jgi:hypothetical protein
MRETSAGARQRSATFKSASDRNGGGCRDSFETAKVPTGAEEQIAGGMRVYQELIFRTTGDPDRVGQAFCIER